MYSCEICNEKADIHHIVHKSEGGFDIEINYMYLCPKHHRGKKGPHHNLKTDIMYKINLQKKLYKLLPKRFYSFKELCIILNTSSNIIKRLTKDLKLYKEGYKKEEIIFILMGKAYYSEELLENIEIEELCANIY